MAPIEKWLLVREKRLTSDCKPLRTSNYKNWKNGYKRGQGGIREIYLMIQVHRIYQ